MSNIEHSPFSHAELPVTPTGDTLDFVLDDSPHVSIQTPLEDKVSSADVQLVHRSTKKRVLLALSAGLLVVGAILGTTIYASQSTPILDVTVGAAGDIAIGACYDTYESNTPGKTDAHFKRMQERFAGVRTFTLGGARNPIDVAAENNLSIYAGVWVKGNSSGLADMQAALDGARRHPQAIKAIMVGNEELQDQTNTEDQLIAKVRQMKQMLKAGGVTNVKVGSVQTDGSWLWARKLAAECDVVGVNIYPFFGGSPVSISNPIQDLAYRYNNITDRYGKGKVVLTETGWPTSGPAFHGHVPSFEAAKKYLNDVVQWVKQGNGGDMPTYFMFHDNLNKEPAYEKAFGVAYANATWKFDFRTTG
ncbi:Aste57867_20767 [Aphanomyces stellatus]|uniref:glucan endo-1,3-beta-D-glucosidase n=1 Tax=Aphanomyces stellatus TaxID=120398 RepID=A0A485LH78_9STRA|nr:hypothetical protein As57867_020699 [Aphanomyces stellatus]VFT97446.1 Aste57867_20767 [Aphanomyces stellatus]